MIISFFVSLLCFTALREKLHPYFQSLHRIFVLNHRTCMPEHKHWFRVRYSGSGASLGILPETSRKRHLPHRHQEALKRPSPLAPSKRKSTFQARKKSLKGKKVSDGIWSSRIQFFLKPFT